MRATYGRDASWGGHCLAMPGVRQRMGLDRDAAGGSQAAGALRNMYASAKLSASDTGKVCSAIVSSVVDCPQDVKSMATAAPRKKRNG